jgi:hypothetical protein
MHFFEIINIVAVAGTTFLMMAVRTIWYSSAVFGKKVPNASIGDEDKTNNQRLMELCSTFCAFAILFSLISYVLGVSPLLPINSIGIGLGFALLLSSFSIMRGIEKARPYSEHLVTAGFYAVLALCGTAVLNYWPW